MPEHDTGIAYRLQRVPGHHDLRGRIRTELQMQSGDRESPRIERWWDGGCGRSFPGSDRAAAIMVPPAAAGGGEQLATTEFQVESAVR